MNKAYPTSAFIAVTLLCNARCVMCDIWKHRGIDFLPVDVYKKLPPSLRMVDLTGGEPFLRPDMASIVRTVRTSCPKARILITTNGFLHHNIEKQIDDIMVADPNIAFRLSLDGGPEMHEKIRRVPKAFQKVMHTVDLLKRKHVKDIGIIYTLMKQNKHELQQVYQYSKSQRIQFSLNVVHDSPVYFGTKKERLRPDPPEVKYLFEWLFLRQLQSVNPKEWAKAWFNKQSYYYMMSHHRALPCGAGENFFYMDPFGSVFMCHLKMWPIGNLRNQSFDEIWTSQAKNKLIPLAHNCNDCWIVCTAKDEIKKNKLYVASETIKEIAKQLRV
ncbi:MAG TPA: radical SAM protein [Patescibacteria group bacterium]|nr:radical SAM protein [Patescibacteria group bacterium]